MTDTLERLRERLAELDVQLLATVNARLETVRDVWAHKREAGLPLVDPEREAWLVENLVSANAGPLSPAGAEQLCRFVLDLTKQEAFVA